MLTDIANFWNPRCHRSTDVPRTLDYDRLTAVTGAAALTAMSWPEPQAPDSGALRDQSQ